MDAKYAPTAIVILSCFEAGIEGDANGDNSEDAEEDVPIPPDFTTTATPPSTPASSAIGLGHRETKKDQVNPSNSCHAAHAKIFWLENSSRRS